MSVDHAALARALAARTTEAFTELLTDDVRWGGQRGGHECISSIEAGAYYATLLDSGVTVHLLELHDDDAENQGCAAAAGDPIILVSLAISGADSVDLPSELRVRLTLRDGLISDIRELEPPRTIELLYFEGCPNHDAFLPHLRQLLDDHAIDVPITTVNVRSAQDARGLRFPGSPTLRVDGRDVDPTYSPREDDDFSLRCRLYSTPSGVAGAPLDEWVLGALIDDPVHEP